MHRLTWYFICTATRPAMQDLYVRSAVSLVRLHLHRGMGCCWWCIKKTRSRLIQARLKLGWVHWNCTSPMYVAASSCHLWRGLTVLHGVVVTGNMPWRVGVLPHPLQVDLVSFSTLTKITELSRIWRSFCQYGDAFLYGIWFKSTQKASKCCVRYKDKGRRLMPLTSVVSDDANTRARFLNKIKS